MAAPTFLDILRSEVARMQAAHPEREGELARARALILHGQVLPSADDPATGQVLSSDGATRYTVNGTCNCSAGQHGKPCKHLQSWRLYQYIARKVEAHTAPEAFAFESKNSPLYEAPASANVHVTIAGRDVLVTLRDRDEGRLLERLARVLAQYPAPEPQPPTPQASTQGEAWCRLHAVAMHRNEKNGKH
jgi:hypothetical protein